MAELGAFSMGLDFEQGQESLLAKMNKRIDDNLKITKKIDKLKKQIYKIEGKGLQIHKKISKIFDKNLNAGKKFLKINKKQTDEIKKQGKLTKAGRGLSNTLSEGANSVTRFGGRIAGELGGWGGQLVEKISSGASGLVKGLGGNLGETVLSFLDSGMSAVKKISDESNLTGALQKIQDVFNTLPKSGIPEVASQIMAIYNSVGNGTGGFELLENTILKTLGTIDDVIHKASIAVQGEVLALSGMLTKLATDIKSFKNIDVFQKVKEAMTALLGGELDKLQGLGDMIKEKSQVAQRVIETFMAKARGMTDMLFDENNWKNVGNKIKEIFKVSEVIELLNDAMTGADELVKAAKGNFLKIQNSFVDSLLTFKETFTHKSGALGMKLMEEVGNEITRLNKWINTFSDNDIESFVGKAMKFFRNIHEAIGNFFSEVGSFVSGDKKFSDINLVKDITSKLNGGVDSMVKVFGEEMAGIRQDINNWLGSISLGSLFFGSGDENKIDEDKEVIKRATNTALTVGG